MRNKLTLLFLLICSPCWGAITFDKDSHGGTEDQDTFTLTSTIVDCANQVLIASVVREESGDTEPNDITWAGGSFVANRVVGDDWSTGPGEVIQYYLLDPTPGEQDLVVTFEGGASVDIVLGFITLCGVKQQAPEATCAGGADMNSCTLDTLTANAMLVSSGGAATNQTWAVDAGGDLTNEAYEQASPPAFGTDGVMGYGLTTNTGTYNCAWTNNGSSDNAGVVCSSWAAADETPPAATGANSIIMFD